jgi:hypothetical protein
MSTRWLVVGLAVSAFGGMAKADIIFEPVTSAVSGSAGSIVEVPFQVRLFNGQNSVEFSYVAFNFDTSDGAIASILGWSWEPSIGGAQGPVTYSHFWDLTLVQNQETLVFGTLSLQLGNVPTGTALISVTQGSGPQWLWQGVNCPETPNFGTLSVTVPSPGALGLLASAGLLPARRRRA